MKAIRAKLRRPAADFGPAALLSLGSIEPVDVRGQQSINAAICHPLTDKYAAAFLPHKRGIRFIGRNRELCPISKRKKYIRKCSGNRIIESRASRVRPVPLRGMF
jgi:hypothetical protein